MDFSTATSSSHKGCREWNIIAFLGFLAIMSVHYIRVYINAIVPTYTENPKLLIGLDSNPYATACRHLSPTFKNASLQFESAVKLKWSALDEASVLGAFYYGYTITPLPAYLAVNANLVSAKWMVGFGVLIAGSLGFLLPLCRVDSWWYMFIVRVLQGFAVGIVSPAMNALLKKWCPDYELHFIRMVIFSGMPVGIILAFLMTGRGYEVELLSRWFNTFTLFGGLVIVWFILWSALIYETPKSHPFLTQQSAKLIDEEVKMDFNNELKPIPWKNIASSHYVWVLATTHFLQDWNHHLLLINLPTYYNDVLHLGPHEIGYLCCIAFMMKWFLSGLSHLLSEKLKNALHFNVTEARKFMNSASTFIPASLLMILSLIICRPIEIVIFLTLAIATTGFKYSGYDKIYSDLCPDYSEILRIVCGCITNVTGLLAPLYVGTLTLNENYLINWAFIFLTNATLLIASGSMFIVFGTAEEQPWGKSGLVEESSCSQDKVPSRKSSSNIPEEILPDEFPNTSPEQEPTAIPPTLDFDHQLIVRAIPNSIRDQEPLTKEPSTSDSDNQLIVQELHNSNPDLESPADDPPDSDSNQEISTAKKST